MTPTKRAPGFMVFTCGIGTSFITLYLLNVFEDHGGNIMGWYANGILPIGAIIAGFASGSGYAIGSRVLNAKLTKYYVIGMLVTGVLDWFGARWVNYSNLLEREHISGDQLSYIGYLQFLCENMVWKNSHGGTGETALGAMGYFYKFLEIAGYALGVMLPSMLLFAQPYCKRCQYYLKKAAAGVIPSTATKKEIGALKKKERFTPIEQAVAEVLGRHGELVQVVSQATYDTTFQAISTLPKREPECAAHILVTLKKCPSCDGHHIASQVINMTADKKTGGTALPAIEKPSVEVAAELAT